MDEKEDKWHGHKTEACGTYPSSGAIITRESSHTVVNVVTTSSDFAVQLPLTRASTEVAAASTEVTVASTEATITYAEVGDVVEVCVAPESVKHAYVWYGATIADSMLGHYEQVDPGKCRLYRYVSGAVWNRYT